MFICTCVYVCVCERTYVSKVKYSINKTPDRRPISFEIGVLLTTSVWLLYDIQIIKQCPLQAAHLNTESILIPEKGSFPWGRYIFSFNKSLLWAYASLTSPVSDVTYEESHLEHVPRGTQHTCWMKMGPRSIYWLFCARNFTCILIITLQDSSVYNLESLNDIN